MSFLYLGALFFSLSGLAYIDRTYRLIFFNDARHALKIIVFLVVFFLAWDIAGIQSDIFFSGESQYMSGIYIIEDLPIEEVFFLILLSYCPLIIYGWLESRHV